MTVDVLFIILMSPFLIIISYFLKVKMWSIIVNMIGYGIAIAFLVLSIGGLVAGSYESDHRRVENRMHSDIIMLIHDRLSGNDLDSAMKVIQYYQIETKDTDFYRNSLHKVIDKVKQVEAQQANASDAASRRP